MYPTDFILKDGGLLASSRSIWQPLKLYRLQIVERDVREARGEGAKSVGNNINCRQKASSVFEGAGDGQEVCTEEAIHSSCKRSDTV